MLFLRLDRRRGKSRCLSLLGVGLLVWSWISGFALGSLSRRTIWLTGSLYFLIWMFPYLTVFRFCWNLFWHGGLPRGSALPIILLTFVLQIALPAASVLAAVMVGVTVLTIWTGGWPRAAIVPLEQRRLGGQRRLAASAILFGRAELAGGLPVCPRHIPATNTSHASASTVNIFTELPISRNCRSFYSSRSAIDGSIRAARRAGIIVAAIEIQHSPAKTAR